ncbi:hypothetical protein ABG067_006052 [Albugo candida]
MKHIAVQWMGVIAFMMINSSRQMDKQGQVSGKGVDENTQAHGVIELFGELMKRANDNSEVTVGVWRIFQYYKAVEDKKPDNERIRYLEDALTILGSSNPSSKHSCVTEKDYMEALSSLAIYFKVQLPESNLAKNDLTPNVLLQIIHNARWRQTPGRAITTIDAAGRDICLGMQKEHQIQQGKKGGKGELATLSVTTNFSDPTQYNLSSGFFNPKLGQKLLLSVQ